MRTLCALLATLAAAAPTANALAWDVSASRPGGDYLANVAASEPVKAPDGAEARPLLTVSCDANGLLAIVTWPDEIPLNERQHFVTAVWSLDGRARSSPMLATPSSVAFGGSSAKEWVHELAGAGRLQVSVPDAHGGQSASFDLAGAAAVEAGLARSGCGSS